GKQMAKKSNKILMATSGKILKSGHMIKWSEEKGNWVKGKRRPGM
ncbi:unnamed protein product, partial [marine sediment metagenome]